MLGVGGGAHSGEVPTCGHVVPVRTQAAMLQGTGRKDHGPSTHKLLRFNWEHSGSLLLPDLSLHNYNGGLPLTFLGRRICPVVGLLGHWLPAGRGVAGMLKTGRGWGTPVPHCMSLGLFQVSVKLKQMAKESVQLSRMVGSLNWLTTQVAVLACESCVRLTTVASESLLLS